MIDDDSCQMIGRMEDLDNLKMPEAYPVANVMFYTPIPFLKDNVMSRLFHFLITDLGINFKTSEFPRLMMGVL